MATRKRKTEGKDDGEVNGEGNGVSPGRTLEFDDFVEHVREHQGELHALCWISASDNERRTIGARLGKLPLAPLETLDDRIEEQWPGPRRIVIRTKLASGAFGVTGYFEVPPPRATATSASSDPMLAAVMKQLDEMRAENKDMRAQLLAAKAPPPPEDIDKQLAGLEKLGNIFKSMFPAPAASTPSPTPTPPPSLKEQLTELNAARDLAKEMFGGVSSAVENTTNLAIKEFSPAINEILKATAAMVAMKVTEEGEKREGDYEEKKRAKEREAAKEKEAARNG